MEKSWNSKEFPLLIRYFDLVWIFVFWFRNIGESNSSHLTHEQHYITAGSGIPDH